MPEIKISTLNPGTYVIIDIHERSLDSLAAADDFPHEVQGTLLTETHLALHHYTQCSILELDFEVSMEGRANDNVTILFSSPGNRQSTAVFL